MSVELDLRKYFQDSIAPRFDATVNLVIEPKAEDEYVELMREGGRPIVYGNHQSHADGWYLGMVVQRLRGLTLATGVDFPGVVLPLAKSIFTGHQGPAVKILNELS